MNIELHVIEDGVDRGPIPSYESITISPVFCDYGAISFTYPKDGKKFHLLDGKDEIEIVPYISGVRQDRFGGIVQEISVDDAEEAAVYTYNGLGYLVLLDGGRVYPKGWPDYDPKEPSWFFVDATAGNYVKTFVQAAQARGSLPGITVDSFTTTQDSNGQPWAKQISLEVTPGTTISAVVVALYEQGLCEFEMVGRDLRLYNPGTLSTDRTLQAKPLTFRKGRDLRDSPRKISSREVATVLLAAGKEDSGLYHEEVDAAAVAGRRRIEGFISNGNITDPGTLNALSEVELAQRVRAKMEKTHGLEFSHPKNPRPLRDFDVGDWAFSDVGKGNEKLRIKQWVLSVGADGKADGSVSMNDLFAEQNERLAKRVAGIIGGTTVTGESRAEDRVPEELIDGLAPAAPEGLVLSSDAYTDDQGNTFAQVTATWLPVTTNADDTALEDLAGYRVYWRYDTDAPGVYRPLTVTDSRADWSPVLPGVQVGVRVAAVDNAGNVSDFSPEESIMAASDATPPEAPAAPLVDNYLGLMRVRTTGQTESGAAWASDTDVAEVWVSPVNNFDPDTEPTAELIDTVNARIEGSSFYKPPYGQTWYAKVIVRDRSGNRSEPSAQNSVATTKVVGDDILDGAVGTAKLANLAVTNAKIGLLAVNDANIGSMNVGKLTAGIMNAEVTVSGRFTTALVGKRVEMNGVGFQGWDATGGQTISLDGLNNLLTGTFRTALTGRRIYLGATTDQLTGRMDFFSPDGDNGYVLAYTQSNGVEAMQLGMRPASAIGDPNWNSLWNRININCSVNGEYTTFKSGSLELSYDGSDVQKSASGLTSGVGAFSVWQAMNRGQTTGSQRMRIDRNWISLWGDPQTYRPRLEMRASDGYMIHGTSINGAFQEFQPDGKVWFNMAVGGGLGIELGNAGNGGGIRMMNGQGFGGIVKFHCQGVGQPQKIEARWWDDTNFLAMWAESFIVNSDEAGKEEIVPAGPMLAKLRSAKVKNYRRKARALHRRQGKDGEVIEDTVVAPLEIGLVAQEAPAQIRAGQASDGSEAIDIYQMAAMMWGSIQELADEVDSLKEGKP